MQEQPAEGGDLRADARLAHGVDRDVHRTARLHDSAFLQLVGCSKRERGTQALQEPAALGSYDADCYTFAVRKPVNIAG